MAAGISGPEDTPRPRKRISCLGGCLLVMGLLMLPIVAAVVFILLLDRGSDCGDKNAGTEHTADRSAG